MYDGVQQKKPAESRRMAKEVEVCAYNDGAREKERTYVCTMRPTRRVKCTRSAN